MTNLQTDIQSDIQAAIDAGYKIELQADGVADVISAAGTGYSVNLRIPTCTCADMQFRGGRYEANGHRICKHLAWVAQTSICPHCGAGMVLTQTADGFRYFECVQCGNAKEARIVKSEREARKEAHRAGRDRIWQRTRDPSWS